MKNKKFMYMMLLVGIMVVAIVESCTLNIGNNNGNGGDSGSGSGSSSGGSGSGGPTYAIGELIADRTLPLIKKTTTPSLTNDGLGGAYGIAVSPNGKNVYVAGQSDTAVVTLNRNTSTGALSYAGVIKGTFFADKGLRGARCIDVSHDGESVYATAIYSNAVAVFERNTTTGALTWKAAMKNGVGTVTMLNTATCLVVSPDGNHVYATGYNDNAVVVFKRNTSTGLLTYETHIKKATGTNDGLGGAYGIAISRDGKNVYATGFNDNALVVLNRNTSTGAVGFGHLTHASVFKDGLNSVDGLAEASHVTVSPDDKTVYVVSEDEHSIVVFNRNTSTGALTYSAVFKYVASPLTNDGLKGARWAAVSSDNKTVYVTGWEEDSVAVFNRNTSTGALTYATAIKKTTTPTLTNDGLGRASGVVVSPDNNNIYVTGATDHAVVTFRRHH